MDNTGTSMTATPKLWNPNAAANWSVVFTPILGAWIHAKNWQELNQPDRAKKSMIWVYAFFVFLIVSFFLPANIVRTSAFIFILAWYFTSAKGQVKYIKTNSVNYDKKGWGKPLLIGLAGLAIYFAVGMLSQPSAHNALVESSSVSLVTRIVQQKGGTATCKAVSIKKEVAKGFYQAIAYLDNGNELKIAIELKNDQIFVSIPKQ